MTGITIEEAGRKIVVTDIGPYLAERDEVLLKLATIYEKFDGGYVGALAAREPEIVELLNRYEFLQYVVRSFDQEAIRRANILDGWEIVKKHRAGDGA
jgi:hypothetical protein